MTPLKVTVLPLLPKTRSSGVSKKIGLVISRSPLTGLISVAVVPLSTRLAKLTVCKAVPEFSILEKILIELPPKVNAPAPELKKIDPI